MITSTYNYVSTSVMIIAIYTNKVVVFIKELNLLFIMSNSFIPFVFRLLRTSVLIKFPQRFTSSSARSVKIMSKHKFFSLENILLLSHKFLFVT